MSGITAAEKIYNRECSKKACPLKGSGYFRLPKSKECCGIESNIWKG